MSEKRQYTNDELVQHIADVEDIRYTMNRMCYYMDNEENRRIINELWVQDYDHRQTASLGYNNGYYTGLDSVIDHLVVARDDARYANLRARADADPSVECSNLNLGYGCFSMHTLTTPLVKVAEDGQTAQYLGYMLGCLSDGKPDGTADSAFLMDLVFADLVREENGWKIWHLAFNHDHTMAVGENYANVPVVGWEDPINASFGDPDIQRTVYNPFFGWENLYFDMPKKLYTYSAKESYGPDGKLGKPYFVRDDH